MDNSFLKKHTSDEREDFHDYKFQGNAGRKGVKKNKVSMTKKTRNVTKNLFKKDEE